MGLPKVWQVQSATILELLQSDDNQQRLHNRDSLTQSGAWEEQVKPSKKY